MEYESLQAGALGAQMRHKLLHSLRYVAKQAGGVVCIDFPKFERACEAVEAARLLSPNAFGIYNDILLAAAEDDLEQLKKLFDEFCSTSLVLNEMVFSHYMDDQTGQPEKNERYARYFNADKTSPLDLRAPDESVANKAGDIATQSLALMRRACPQLAEEIDELVSEVVFCSSSDTETGKFGGAACFQLWGAVLLNADEITDRINFIQSLSHESGHVKLFACATEDPLVHNPPDELFSSPLRNDPRPMDGIFHATYVLARMHWSASCLCASNELESSEIDHLEKEMGEYRIRFEDGIQTVGKHAKLSPTGSRLIADAANYINELDNA